MSADNTKSLPRLLAVESDADSRIAVRYDDGTIGTVDLSDEIRRGGVFAALADPATFALVRIGEFGQIEWPNGVDLCPDALYLRLTRKTPDQLFPELTRQSVDA